MLWQDGGGHALRKTPETVFLVIENVRHEGPILPSLRQRKHEGIPISGASKLI